MTTLPLSTRLAKSITSLLRPTMRRRAEAAAPRFDARALREVGFSDLEISIMRRMW